MYIMQGYKSMKKALTIGELLITMAIIGVIAMLVLPGFLKDYHKKIYTAKLKKTIELVENAVNQASIDNNVSYFYQTPYPASDDKIKEFLDKYFKTVASGDNIFYSGYYSSIKDSSSTTSGSSNKGSKLSPKNAVKLAGGEALSFECTVNTGVAIAAMNSNLCTIRIDVNATDGPNKGGRDLFVLYLDTKNNSINSRSPLSAKIETCQTSALGDECYEELLKNNWIMDY